MKQAAIRASALLSSLLANQGGQLSQLMRQKGRWRQLLWTAETLLAASDTEAGWLKEVSLVAVPTILRRCLQGYAGKAWEEVHD